MKLSMPGYYLQTIQVTSESGLFIMRSGSSKIFFFSSNENRGMKGNHGFGELFHPYGLKR